MRSAAYLNPFTHQITGRIASASHDNDGSLELALLIVVGGQLIWQRVILLDAETEGFHPLVRSLGAGDKITLTGRFAEIPFLDPEDGHSELDLYFILASLAIDPVRSLWYVPEHQRSAMWHGVSPAIDEREDILVARREWLAARVLPEAFRRRSMTTLRRLPPTSSSSSTSAPGRRPSGAARSIANCWSRSMGEFCSAAPPLTQAAAISEALSGVLRTAP